MSATPQSYHAHRPSPVTAHATDLYSAPCWQLPPQHSCILSVTERLNELQDLLIGLLNLRRRGGSRAVPLRGNRAYTGVVSMKDRQDKEAFYADVLQSEPLAVELCQAFDTGAARECRIKSMNAALRAQAPVTGLVHSFWMDRWVSQKELWPNTKEESPKKSWPSSKEESQKKSSNTKEESQKKEWPSTKECAIWREYDIRHFHECALKTSKLRKSSRLSVD